MFSGPAVFTLGDNYAEESALADFERDIDRLGNIEFGFDAGDAFVVEVNRTGFDEPLRFAD